MTNPNNAIGTNGAFGGRTSVNAFNDVMGALSRGILSGWACVPNSGLTVSLGGNGTTRDAAIAEDNAGNKTSINNISNSPINVTIGAAPGSNSRIDAIVAYVDNPPTGNATETDNPDACGLIVVQGTTASTPVKPSDAQIRSGITSDGASGTTAYYVVLAYITMASGTTDITSGEIAAGPISTIGNNMVPTTAIPDAAITASKIDFTTLNFGNYSVTEQDTGFTWVDGKHIYKKTIDIGTPADSSSKLVAHGITNLGTVVKIEGMLNGPSIVPLPFVSESGSINCVEIVIDTTDIRVVTGSSWWYSNNYAGYITLYYTKSS